MIFNMVRVLLTFLVGINTAFSQDKLDVAVAGMNHDHIFLLLKNYQQKEVNIVGIAENDQALIRHFQEVYKLPDSLFYRDVKTMLQHVHPDAVLAYNPIAKHIDVAEICLPLKIPLMVEKPLAVTTKQAQRMAHLARVNNTLLLTNYETTWYNSNQQLKKITQTEDFGKIHKMIAKDGHQGPKEIGCSRAFLDWLTDPKLNGGGAIVDFGCYGANLMTWLLNNEKPVAVTAITRHIKPKIYPKVDDDATILLEYENGTTGIIEASWDWSYNIKDLQVYGDETKLHAKNGGTLVSQNSPTDLQPQDLQETYYKDQITYLQAVLNGDQKVNDDLSSLKNNLIVVEILEAAKKSAREGKRITLKK